MAHALLGLQQRLDIERLTLCALQLLPTTPQNGCQVRLCMCQRLSDRQAAAADLSRWIASSFLAIVCRTRRFTYR